MKVLIGAPVYKRAWILHYWLDRIEKQSFSLSDIGFVFLANQQDHETIDLLLDWHSQHPQVQKFNVLFTDGKSDKDHPNGRRSWQRADYSYMADMRNTLLEFARAIEPNRYFSLDTDILLDDPNTIQKLYDLTASKADAAAPLMFMAPNNTRHPSTMTWRGDDAFTGYRNGKYDFGSVFQTDIIMAAKMMSKKVYENVQYIYHRQGEDLGWSRDCKLKGYKLYAMFDTYAPHIMSEKMLDNYLRFGDDRSKIIIQDEPQSVITHT